MTGLRKIAERNKFNLENKAAEEFREFRVALEIYLKHLKKEKCINDNVNEINLRIKQKAYENVLDEIADCLVMKVQAKINNQTISESTYLTRDEERYFDKFFREEKEYIKSVMNYKIKRTMLRNKVNYYDLTK
jgi:hypothetical protein